MSILGRTLPSRLARRALPVVQLGARRVRNEKSPFQMTFSLTNRCNFRCDYCHIPLQKREEMTTAEWKRAMTEFRDGGMGRASLIGGEPLLREDAGELIEHLRSLGVHTAMNTNGWYVRDRIAEVSRLDLVCITLDGPRELHDAQRRRGSYDRVIDAIGLLRSRGVPVVTMTVVTPKGAHTIDHVLDVARDLGFQAFFQLEHDASVDVHAPVALGMTDRQIASLADRLREAKKCGLPVGNSYTLLEMQARDGRRIGGDCGHCYAGRYFGYVFSDGTVAPCLLTQWQQQTGNGRARGFVEAFHTMNPPRGPGCACVPIHEVNRILSFDFRVLFDALKLAVAPSVRRVVTT
jgi:MoaA/NifB/PqqE/SkfB family radical SAM enzyme